MKPLHLGIALALASLPAAADKQRLPPNATYKAECASCHQADFGGDGFAPGLAGPEFASAWNDLSVGDLYERIRVSMPPSNPGALAPANARRPVTIS